MTDLKKTHLIANLFWLALSAYVCVEAWSLRVGDIHAPGPGFLPFWTGLILFGLTVVSLIQTIKLPVEGTVAEFWGKANYGKLVLIMAVLFLYAFLMERLGFLPATFLVLLFLFRTVEPYRWTTVLFASLVTIAVTYLVFVYLLDSRLPEMPWRF